MRAGIYTGRELTLLGFIKQQSILKLAEKQSLAMLGQQVPDPKLRAKLTPHFRLGCKRVLLSNDYYPALAKPNVDVVTERIVEVTETGIITESVDGQRVEHPVDAIIFGTGFRIGDLPISHQVRGADGRTIAEHWAEGGMAALHGTTVAGFPNAFMIVGPNTGLGHNSIVLMIEAQVRYLMDLFKQMNDQQLGTVEPRRDVQDAYNEDLQQRLQHTVWNTGGCQSWYLDDHGRNTTLWPTFTFTFMRRLRRASLNEYVVRPRQTERKQVAA